MVVHSEVTMATTRELLADLALAVERLEACNATLTREAAHHERKWRDYERDFILPCFDLADRAGIDLRQLVSECKGNCVVALINELVTQRDRLRERYTDT